MTGVLAGPGSFHNRRQNRQWQASDSPYTARPVQFRTALKSTLCGKKSVSQNTVQTEHTLYIRAEKKFSIIHVVSFFPLPLSHRLPRSPAAPRTAPGRVPASSAASERV